MTFFLDNTNPPRFAVALRAFDHDVRHLMEVSDPLWSQFQLIVKAWQEIVAVGERARPGDCYEVQRNGKVTFYVPKR